jgi:alanine racemase
VHDHPTRVLVHLDRLAHNLRLLRDLAGGRPVWPAVKANAYGHGLVLVARELVALGCDTLCVAHPGEGRALREAGVDATLVLLSAALPEASAAIVAGSFEPAVCDLATVEALSREARRAGREMALHLKVDTGMGRTGIRPEEVEAFLARCRALPGLRVRGLMSHLARADETDKSFSERQIETFARLREATQGAGIEVYHLANSAGVLDLPASRFDTVRPGIALYGLAPSPDIRSPRARELQPVLEWRTRITFLKEVPAGTGLSYGHTFRARRPSRVATLPVGYGDGLSRRLSNRMEVLVGGVRCPQVGTITMDQCLVDVSALDRVAIGDEVVLIGGQDGEEASADVLAATLGTISYEIVTAVAARVPRVAVGGVGAPPGARP